MLHYSKIIQEALVHHGFSPDAARRMLEGHEEATRADSDHSAYRELADEIIAVHDALELPDFMPGDFSELEIMKKFVGWLPDLVRHQDAEYLREGINPFAPHVLDHYADELDPFEPDGRGLRRKTTGEPVPVADKEEE